MEQFEIIVITLLGLEAVAAREIRQMGLETKAVEDGRITLVGTFREVAMLNIGLRTAERVLIKVGSYEARTFDQLFEGCKALPWEAWILKDGAFPVKGYSLKSKLHSVPDCQSILKKSIVERLRAHGGSLRETGVQYQIQFSLMKDVVTLMIDTSGAPLYKRGYRTQSNLAPVRETIGAAMVLLSFWREGRVLADPFCGSGTIPIEAALIGKKMAPGLWRRFAFESFYQTPSKAVGEVRAMAKEAVCDDADLLIYASDIDPRAIDLTAKNAENARVDDVVRLKQNPVEAFSSTYHNGVMICNPPYGERMLEKSQAEEIYRQMGRVQAALQDWSLYCLTSHEKFEEAYGKKADKKRKIYNGMLKCYLYQYFGPKPEK